jgi:hypothetical protein
MVRVGCRWDGGRHALIYCLLKNMFWVVWVEGSRLSLTLISFSYQSLSESSKHGCRLWYGARVVALFFGFCLEVVRNINEALLRYHL